MKRVAVSWGEGFLECLGRTGAQQMLVPRVMPGSLGAIRAGCGWGHSVVLREDGKVMVCGREGDFRNTSRLLQFDRGVPALARVVNWFSEYVFSVDPLLREVGGCGGKELRDFVSDDVSREFEGLESVSCGPGAMTSGVYRGGVWSLGSNLHGELGGGKASPLASSGFVPVLGVENALSVHSGFQFSTVLDQSGRVWGWGKNGRGELGLGDRDPRFEPTQIGLEGVTKLGTGFAHCVAVHGEEEEEVYVWGRLLGPRGNDRRGGVVGTEMDALSPRKLGFGGKVKDVACTQASVSVLEEDGSVWMCGMRSRGQRWDPCSSMWWKGEETKQEVWEETEGSDWRETELIRIANADSLVQAARYFHVLAGTSTCPGTPVALKGGVHCVAVLFSCGAVVRVGWKMQPEPLLPLALLASMGDVVDLSMGIRHAVAVLNVKDDKILQMETNDSMYNDLTKHATEQFAAILHASTIM